MTQVRVPIDGDGNMITDYTYGGNGNVFTEVVKEGKDLVVGDKLNLANREVKDIKSLRVEH